MAKREARFVRRKEYKMLDDYYVIVDRQTGVNYLCMMNGALTPLLDNLGNVVVSPLPFVDHNKPIE